MRSKKRFSEIGDILQSKIVAPGQTSEIFKLEMPENYIGFLYYLANDFFPMQLNIDGETIDINTIIAPINSPKLFDPPFLIKNFIKVTATNTTEQSKKISFYADGVGYCILSLSEEILVSEMTKVKTSLKESKIGEADKLSEYIKAEEARPRFPHIVNYSIHESNKWYEIMLPKKGVKTWNLKCREDYDINYCFEPSAATYMTLSNGQTLSEDTAPQGVHAIYVRCAEADVTIEFELWRE